MQRTGSKVYPRACRPDRAAPPAGAPSPADGGVLLLSLLLLSVLGLLTLSSSLLVRAASRRVARHGDHQVARAAALEALVRTSILIEGATNAWQALDQDWAQAPETPPAQPASPQGWVEGPDSGRRPFADSRRSPAGLRDAEAMINLNTAPPPLLERVFEIGGGISRPAAREMARELVAWRTPPDEQAAPSSPAAASTCPYRRAGVAWSPAHAPLGSLEELRLMPGGEDLDLCRLSELATVYGRGKVNLNTASPEVLRLLFEHAATDLSRIAAGRLLERVVESRRQGRPVEAPTAEAIARAYGDGRAGALSPAENALVGRLLEQALVDVVSEAFIGVAIGLAPSSGGGSPVSAGINFVWDRRRQAVYWREDPL